LLDYTTKYQKINFHIVGIIENDMQELLMEFTFIHVTGKFWGLNTFIKFVGSKRPLLYRNGQ
jgi:hypothetical protein